MDGEIFKEWTKDGFDLEAKMVPDYDGDTSWLGSYHEERHTKNAGDSDSAFEVPAVVTRSGYLYRHGRPCYFRPQGGCEENWQADEDRLRDYYLEQWYFVGVVVTASRSGIALGNASLWGIESDGEEYMLEVAGELETEAVDEAKATIEQLTEGA